MFHIQVVTEYPAAVAQMEKIVGRPSNEFHPKKHHLHEATSAGRRYGIFAEIAFRLDQAEEQFGIEAGACRLVSTVLRNVVRSSISGIRLASSVGRRISKRVGSRGSSLYRWSTRDQRGGKKLSVCGYIGRSVLGRTQTWVRQE